MNALDCNQQKCTGNPEHPGILGQSPWSWDCNRLNDALQGGIKLKIKINIG